MQRPPSCNGTVPELATMSEVHFMQYDENEHGKWTRAASAMRTITARLRYREALSHALHVDYDSLMLSPQRSSSRSGRYT